MFDLVADVERYPEFLPLCEGLAVRSRKERDGKELLIADMTIGYKAIRETFTTQVLLNRAERAIHVEYVNGPFKYLNNHWKFLDGPQGGCIIDFHVDFEFKSRVLQQLIGLLFDEAVRRMVAAFETRARKLHGDRGPSRPVNEAGEVALLPRG